MFTELSWLNMDMLDTPNAKHFMIAPERNS